MIRRGAIAALLSVPFLIALAGVHHSGQAYTLDRSFGVPVNHQPPPGRGWVVDLVVRSPALGRWPADVRVYLPAAYRTQPTRRFPTIYLLQGMPGSSRGAFENAMHIAHKMDDGFVSGRLQPMIVVMPPGNHRRFDLATEWANGGTRTSDWDTYLSRDVVSAVDRHFRTIPAASARGVAGYSAGADGAINALILHPGVFRVAEGWSADLRQTPSLVGYNAALVRRYSAIEMAAAAAPTLRRLGASVYLYVGAADRILQTDQQFVAILRRAGVHVRFSVLPGGHSWLLWHRQEGTALAYLSAHLHE
jgi:S-formylglutathione hydrolase FrmB